LTDKDLFTDHHGSQNAYIKLLHRKQFGDSQLILVSFKVELGRAFIVIGGSGLASEFGAHPGALYKPRHGKPV
jgi:hypothetical protein